MYGTCGRIDNKADFDFDLTCQPATLQKPPTSMSHPPPALQYQSPWNWTPLDSPMLHRPTVQFLRYIIGQDGNQMDQGKVTVIREWPRPQTVKELQRFLCFANFYRRFIKDFNCWAVLSQQFGEPPRLQPCAYYCSPNREPHSVEHRQGHPSLDCSQDGAEDGSRVASSEKTLQVFVCFFFFFVVLRVRCC